MANEFRMPDTWYEPPMVPYAECSICSDEIPLGEYALKLESHELACASHSEQILMERISAIPKRSYEEFADLLEYFGIERREVEREDTVENA